MYYSSQIVFQYMYVHVRFYNILQLFLQSAIYHTGTWFIATTLYGFIETIFASSLLLATKLLSVKFLLMIVLHHAFELV
jgi:hypothetical protein